jgi:hypothetical protein
MGHGGEAHIPAAADRDQVGSLLRLLCAGWPSPTCFAEGCAAREEPVEMCLASSL